MMRHKACRDADKNAGRKSVFLYEKLKRKKKKKVKHVEPLRIIFLGPNGSKLSSTPSPESCIVPSNV